MEELTWLRMADGGFKDSDRRLWGVLKEFLPDETAIYRGSIIVELGSFRVGFNGGHRFSAEDDGLGGGGGFRVIWVDEELEHVEV